MKTFSFELRLTRPFSASVSHSSPDGLASSKKEVEVKCGTYDLHEAVRRQILICVLLYPSNGLL